MNDFKWSKTEKKIARTAFEKVYQRECSDLIEIIRTKTGEITEPDNIWRFHDFLTEKRDEIDENMITDTPNSFLCLPGLLKTDGWILTT